MSLRVGHRATGAPRAAPRDAVLRVVARRYARRRDRGLGRGALEPGEQRVWDGMGRADRAEGVAVAARVRGGRRRRGRTRRSGARPRCCTTRASSCSGFGTFGRVVATVVTAGAGEPAVRGWADRRRRAAGRGSAATPPTTISAPSSCAQAGARPDVAAWAGAHHRPDRWAATGIPETVCRALADADGEP